MEKKLLRINNWQGRLGNNIIQLINILSIALLFNFNIEIPKHDFFKKQYININKNLNYDEELTDIYNFFHMPEKFKFYNYKNYIDQIKIILMDLFKIDYKKFDPLDDNSVVIHIRSGDIFTDKNPNENYINPPLDYYIHILEKYRFKKIYLIAEDSLNPCINKLLEKYPNIYFSINSLEKDIEYILRAKNIIMSYGSFVPSLVFLTNYTKNIFIPSYAILIKNDAINIFPVIVK